MSEPKQKIQKRERRNAGVRRRRRIIWEGRNFFAINKFDGIIVDLVSYAEGGSYFTALPISPKEYRRENPTSARAEIYTDHYFTTFIIYDDWGGQHCMKIPNDMKEAVKQARAGLAEHDLIRAAACV